MKNSRLVIVAWSPSGAWKRYRDITVRPKKRRGGPYLFGEKVVRDPSDRAKEAPK